MNIEQWHAHPSFRKELEELLNHPTFKAALEIVKDTGNQPVIPTAMPPGVTLTEWYATLGAKRDGYFAALTNLRSLAQTQPARRQGEKPWENTTQRPEQPKTT